MGEIADELGESDAGVEGAGVKDGGAQAAGFAVSFESEHMIFAGIADEFGVEFVAWGAEGDVHEGARAWGADVRKETVGAIDGVAD